MQRAWEINGDEELHSIELHIAEVPLGDVHAEEALAPSLRRSRIEVAGTTVVATAALEPLAL
jgi:hypothetical protein